MVRLLCSSITNRRFPGSFIRFCSLCALLVLFVSSCGSGHPAESAVQRYAVVAPGLTIVTAESSLVSRDMSRMRSALAASDAQLVRRQSVLLRANALRLARDAGHEAAQIRQLTRYSMTKVLRRYLVMTLQALTQDWWESRHLSFLASLLYADPFIMVGTNAVRAIQMSKMARAEAATATSLAGQAAQWRRTYWRAFRYIPVTPSATS